MNNYQKAKDIFIQRKTSADTFEEYPLIVQPNSIIITDSDNNLLMILTSSFTSSSISSSHSNTASVAIYAFSTDSSSFASSSISSSYTQTASYVASASYYPIIINVLSASFASSSISASYALGGYLTNSLSALTSDFALLAGNSINSTSASYSLTSSYYNQLWLKTGSNYPITTSWSDISLSSNYISGANVGGFVNNSIYSTSSSFASSSLTASFAISSSNVFGNGTIQGSSYQINGNIFTYVNGNYTILNSDNGKIITVNSGSTSILRVSNSLDSTFNCMVYQSGSGTITFIAENGNYIRNRSSANGTAGQYAIATLLRVNNTDFVLGGDVI